MTTKVTGVDVLILVKDGSDYKVVGGQRGASLSESRATIDVTSKKSTGGYKEHEYGLAEWSISCDGVYVENEANYGLLVTAMRNSTKVVARWQEGTTNVFEGTCLVTSRDLEAPYDGEATYSMELQGDGAPVLSGQTSSGD